MNGSSACTLPQIYELQTSVVQLGSPIQQTHGVHGVVAAPMWHIIYPAGGVLGPRGLLWVRWWGKGAKGKPILLGLPGPVPDILLVHVCIGPVHETAAGKGDRISVCATAAPWPERPPSCLPPSHSLHFYWCSKTWPLNSAACFATSLIYRNQCSSGKRLKYDWPVRITMGRLKNDFLMANDLP